MKIPGWIDPMMLFVIAAAIILTSLAFHYMDEYREIDNENLKNCHDLGYLNYKYLSDNKYVCTNPIGDAPIIEI